MKEKFNNRNIVTVGNVIDIREELMVRNVEDNAVQFIPVGESGDNYIITLSKNALIAIREGKSFPIELLAGGKKKTIILMRDNTYRDKMRLHNKLAQQAKEQVETTLQVDAEMNAISQDLGNKIQD